MMMEKFDLQKAIEELKNGKNEVILPYEDDEECNALEVSLYYQKGKGYHLTTTPIFYKVERGMISKSFMIFGKSSRTMLNNEIVQRKSKKVEVEARGNITIDLINTMIKNMK